MATVGGSTQQLDLERLRELFWAPICAALNDPRLAGEERGERRHSKTRGGRVGGLRPEPSG